MKRSSTPRFRRVVTPANVALLLVLAAACDAEQTSSSSDSNQDAGSRASDDPASRSGDDRRSTSAGSHNGEATDGPDASPTHGTTDTAGSNDPKPSSSADSDGSTWGSPSRPPVGETSVPTGPTTPPPASCDADGGDATVSAPTLLATLSSRWHEAWLASPAVADLDEDGVAEILVARDELLLGWHLDNTVVFSAETGGRIWAPPVVADLLPDVPGLEVAAAARENIYVWDAHGTLQPGFPTTWRDEVRALAAGDIDNDGALELVAVTTRELVSDGQADILIAYELNGDVASGFPPNTSGTSGCGATCYVHGGFDQTLALGDLNGDGAVDIFAPQDNAYVSLHRGDGFAFDAVFDDVPKVNGVRFLHDLTEAKQGYSEHEDTSLQAHFTNSAPAIADLDGDGRNDLIVLGSVQNAAQSEREHGVALWAFRPDGTRLDAWQSPLHVPQFLAGLWDYEDTNVVAATNQVSVADITPESNGLEIVFAGFDGQIHAASAAAELLWSHRYTSDDRVLTGGVVIADLSADGSPEIIFNTYSPDNDKGKLVILDAAGDELHSVALPERGAMPVPTVADVDGDGSLEIVVSLKDGVDRERQVLVYNVASSRPNCMPWPTGRGNLLRTGFVH